MPPSPLLDRELTAVDYLNYNDGTDTRYELVNGKLLEMPPESNLNARIAVFLLVEFLRLVPFMQLCHKDTELQVASVKASFRIPDLMVLSEAGATAISGRSRNTITLEMPPPRLVVEVVSSDDPARDYRYKRSEYAVRAIPEYWIIDAIRQQVSVLTLAEGFYDQVVYQGSQRLISITFPEIILTPNQILDPKL